jgi:hypothetical protein
MSKIGNDRFFSLGWKHAKKAQWTANDTTYKLDRRLRLAF